MKVCIFFSTKKLGRNKVNSNQKLTQYKFYTRKCEDYLTLSRFILFKSYEKNYAKLNFEGSDDTAQKTPQETVDLVTFTEEILNGKLHFLCR